MEGAKAARKALEIDPSSTAAKRSLASNLKFSDNDEDFQEAIQLYTSLVEDTGEVDDLVDFAYALGRSKTYGRKDRSNEAIIAAKKALEIDPSSTTAKRALAINLKFSDHDDDIQEAIRLYTSLADDTGDVDDWVNLAEAYVTANQNTEGAKAARKAIEIDPFSEAAKRSLELAMELETPERLNFRGSQQRKNGELDNAKETYLKSIALGSNTGPAYYGLGLTYLDMGDVSAAIYAFKKAPNHKKAQARLAALLNDNASAIGKP